MGATEYFARRVARNAGKHPSTAYPDEHAGIAALAGIVGDAMLASTFFSGKSLAMELAVDDKRGQGKFHAWADAMRTKPGTAAAVLSAAPPSQ